MNPPAVEAAPLCWRRSFAGGALQARAVRRFVACLLDGCPFLDDVLLAVDEFWGWHGNEAGRTVTAVLTGVEVTAGAKALAGEWPA